MNRIEFLANLDKYKGEDHSTFLEHYGILGQKWGQRRWQNADGTFNTEGKIRYFGSQKAQAEQNTADERIGGKFSDLNDKFVRAQARFATKHPNLTGTQGLTEDEIYSAYQNFRFLNMSGVNPFEQRRANLNALKAAKQAKELAERNPEVEKAITGSINKRNADMEETKNEDMLIGASPEKKAYKAKVKELKAQAKEMGVPFGERGHLAKYCAKNGIDEITDKIVQGHKAGDDLWSDSIRMNNATDQIDHFVQHTKRGEHVRSDKNVKEFTENNKNFKDFQKNVEKMNKTLKKANDELISKLKKAGLDLNPILVDSNNVGKTVRLDYYKEGTKEYQILNKAFQEVYKGSMQTEFKKYAKEARENLGYFEKDCHDFAKEYLVDQAEYNDPYRYAFTYEKDTGKTRSTKMYETYGYLMTEPYWNEVGGP